jgi:hypothetical protein
MIPDVHLSNNLELKRRRLGELKARRCTPLSLSLLLLLLLSPSSLRPVNLCDDPHAISLFRSLFIFVNSITPRGYKLIFDYAFGFSMGRELPPPFEDSITPRRYKLVFDYAFFYGTRASFSSLF